MGASPGPATVLAERLAAQLLSGPPATSAVEVTSRLLAVQAQDLRGARLSLRSRSKGLAASDVDAALADRSMVVDWLNRGTLHLVLTEDRPWLHLLLAPGLVTNNARRLAQEGVSPDDADRGVDVLVTALADGPVARASLREALDAAGVPTEGQAFAHVLMAAALRGELLRGPVLGKEQAFVSPRGWLPPAEPVGREQALVLLAERYLAGHAPASDRDLARWSGLPLGDVRAGLRGVRVEQRPDGLLQLPGQVLDAPLPPPRLLGAFEPVLLGWTSRADVVGPHVGLVTDNGLFRPFAMVDGRAVATWRWSSAAGGSVTVEPLEPLAADVLAALERDALDVTRYLTT